MRQAPILLFRWRLHAVLPQSSPSTLNKIPQTTSNHPQQISTITCNRFPQFSTQATGAKSEYFAMVQHMANIVRHDLYMERTLNRLSFPLTSELVFRVLRASSQLGIESFRFFNWACAHQPGSYTPTAIEFEELFRTLARTRYWKKMWIVAESMRNRSLPISSQSVAFAIEEYGRSGLTDSAVELFNKCKNLNCLQTTGVYNSLLFSLCEVKNFHGAYALIRRMIRKGGKPDKRTFSVLVNAWCSAGKMREARSFLEEMSRKGFSPPVRGSDLLVEGLMNAGYLESAKEMVKKMIKEGCLPNLGTFNLLLESVCKYEEVDFVLGLYYDVSKLGLCLDINTYKIMISAVSKSDRIDEAFGILLASVDTGYKPFPSLYAPVIKALCKRGRFDDAFGLFSDMKVRGHPPNRPVYTMLITLCARGGRFVDGANYILEMTNSNFVPLLRCFTVIIEGLKTCGEHELAKRIDELMVAVSVFENGVQEIPH